ncbi:adhesion G-protein coupled receptor F3-like [Leptodactylus fuscus]
MEFGNERVRRQVSSLQIVYEYVHYMDIMLEGYASVSNKAYITNLSSDPYTLLLMPTVNVSKLQFYITTECNMTDTGNLCTCKDGYRWNITVCYTYLPCNNSSSFCSCLFIPDNHIPYCENPKSISNYRVNINGSVTLNQTFSNDLLDPTSVTYKMLESNITLALLNVYTKTCNPLNVSVVGFSPGSVVANYSMLVSGQLSASQVLSSNNLVAQSLPGVISSQLSTSGVAYIDPVKLDVRYLDSIQLTCQINETINFVNWSLTTNNITNMIYSGGKNVAISMQVQSDKTISVLNINKVDILWEGNRTDLNCYSLAPPHPSNDTNFTCTFTNQAGQQKYSSIPVTIIQVGDTYCGTNTSYGLTWNITKAGMSAIATCPYGKYGSLTRDCSPDGVWLMVQDNCINQNLQKALSNAQILDEGLGSSSERVPEIIQQMSNSSGALVNNTAEVAAVVTILGTISRIASGLNNTFDSDVVTGFLSLASNITDPNYTSLWKDPNCPPASTVLHSVELFSQLLYVQNGSFEIDLENIQLKGDVYEMGQAGQDYKKNFKNLGVSMSIDQLTISSLLQNSDVKITSVAFNTIGGLLQSTTKKFNNSKLNSHVQSTSIRLSDSTSVSSHILMSFETNTSDKRYSQSCVFWDFTLPGSGGSWSDFGCTSKVEDNITYCSCSHLTSFAVLMSINVEYLAVIEEITYVGLGVSILSLCICVFIEWYVWKSVVRTNISYFRHSSLVNIAVSLLCADVCFLSSAFPSIITEKLICLSITFLNHFFYLALFFWTFAQSVMLLHQLLFVFHHLRKKVYVSLSFLVGYLVPAIIAAGTFLYFYPKDRYRHEKMCWLNPETGAIYAFAVPAGSIIVFNFLTLLVVIAKLSRPSVSDKSHAEDRDTAKSILKAILVLTPVFGLTWSFGFALLTELDNLTRQIFTYGFAAMNAFQGFFILLTCITERKVREVLLNTRTSSGTSTATTTTSMSEAPGKMTASIKKKK